MPARSRILVAVLVVAACAAPPPPPRPPLTGPQAASLVECYPGSPLSGPRAGAAPFEGQAESALRVTVRLVALEELPEHLLEPLAGQRRLVAAVGSGSALRAVSDLARGARAGLISDAGSLAHALEAGSLGRVAPLRELEAALPPGVTARLGLERDVVRQPGRPLCREAISLLVGRSPDGERLELGVGVEDAPRGEVRGELHLLGPFPGPALELGLVLPIPFPGSRAAAVAFLLSVRPAPAPGQPGFAAHQDAFRRCLGDLARASVLAAPAAPPPLAAPPRGGPTPELDALRDPERQRAALLQLADGAGAPLCADLALGGDPAAVAAIAAAVAAVAGGEAGGAWPPDGWALERRAADCLGRLALAGDAAPWVGAVLSRHVGGLAYLPSALRVTLDAPDLEAWRRRLQAENLSLLEEGWPSLRLHGAEWLRARDLLPPGYDPLAPAEARAAALAASEGGS